MADTIISKQRVDSEVRKVEELDSEVFSQADKGLLNPLSTSQQYNLSSNQNKGLNQPNFITSEDNKVVDVWQSPGKISEAEKIEIIKLGFQRQAEGKISLKKYYESTDPYSLFQYKRYSIKYEAIRKNKLYKQFKP